MHKDLKRLRDGIFTHKPSLTTLTTALRTQYSMQATVVSRERELKGEIIVEFGVNRCHDRYYGGTQGPVSHPGSRQGSPLRHSDVLVSGAFGCTQSTEMKYDITEAHHATQQHVCMHLPHTPARCHHPSSWQPRIFS